VVQITALGRKMASFPLPPSLSRILLFAAEHEVIEPILTIVAMLSVEVLYIRPPQAPQTQQADEAHQLLKTLGGDDFCALLYIYDCYERKYVSCPW
jgi:HrpA-like RNA helicase